MDNADAFRKALEAAYADEVDAVETYDKMAAVAPHPWMALEIDHIRRQEAHHAWVFANMLNLMGWWPVRRK